MRLIDLFYIYSFYCTGLCLWRFYKEWNSKRNYFFLVLWSLSIISNFVWLFFIHLIGYWLILCGIMEEVNNIRSNNRFFTKENLFSQYAFYDYWLLFIDFVFGLSFVDLYLENPQFLMHELYKYF